MIVPPNRGDVGKKNKKNIDNPAVSTAEDLDTATVSAEKPRLLGNNKTLGRARQR